MHAQLARLQRALVDPGLVDAHDEVGEGALGDGIELRGGQREGAREEAALRRLRGPVLEGSVGWIEAGRAREESSWRWVAWCGKPGWSPVYPGSPLGGKPGVPRPSIQAAGLCSALACDPLVRVRVRVLGLRCG